MVGVVDIGLDGGRDGGGLFGALAEQRSPAPERKATPRLRVPERRQVTLRAVSLEELVPAEHRVRLVWRFVEGLDLSLLYARIKAVEGRPGHPPADPRLLVALWLYATVEGIGSARALARLCREHVAYQWLCGGVGVDHKTLSDFRLGHGAVLERQLVDSFTALLHGGVARLERIAQDGMRVRAAAGAASFRRRSTLRACRAQAAAEVARLRAELEADPAACSRRRAAARERAALDRERRVSEALAIALALQAESPGRAARERGGEGDGGGGNGSDVSGPAPEPAPEPAKEPRVSTTDPEARVMKMADGGFRPAWNVQLAVDVESGAVAAVAVDNRGTDMGRLVPMSDRLQAAYGARQREHLADGGFAKLADIEALAEAGVSACVPVPTPRDRARDPHVPRQGDAPGVAAWRVRMGGEEAKAVYRRRAASVECANAQARNRGLVRLLVRSAEKVKAVVLWLALAHNMACSWRLQPA
jgi:transposase